jgi:hypothetical protein
LDRKSRRKKSSLAGDVVVSSRDGPAARKSGMRVGSMNVMRDRVDDARDLVRLFTTEDGADDVKEVDSLRSKDNVRYDTL